MSLPDYIERNMERLLSEWIEFAGTRLPASDFLDSAALADGSKRLLQAVVADMKSAQSETERKLKSRGESDFDSSETVKEHAHDRLKAGFTLDQLVSEYRALRATVIRGWTSEMGAADRPMLDELVRFNEAMDQSLTDAIRWFNDGLERTRDIFLGVLGHDLRDPLNTALTANELQQLTEGNPEASRRAREVATRSLHRMADMIRDLLDFARTRLDGPLRISREPADMGEICREIVDALALGNSGRDIRLELSGNLTGRWDSGRIKQVASNLITNALQHGSADSPIDVAGQAESDEVVLTVYNEGPPIQTDRQYTIFDPFTKNVASEQNKRQPGRPGLGLYIVKQIVDAHGGSIELESGAPGGTKFTVRLPKSPS